MRVEAMLRSMFVAAILAATSPARAQTASCYDGMQNGPESDVDCGGDCVPCALDQRCVAARDCSSGRCVRGECQEYPWESGAAVPTGYRVEVSSTDAAATARRAGIWFFGISYAGAYIGALALPQRLSWLYVPVLGPWGALQQDDLGGALRAALVADGALQAAGAALLIGGIVGRGHQLVRGEVVATMPRSVAVAPRALLTPAGLGFGIDGCF